MIKHAIYLSITLISTYAVSSESTYVGKAREWAQSTRAAYTEYVTETVLPFMENKRQALETLVENIKTSSAYYMNRQEVSAPQVMSVQPDVVIPEPVALISVAQKNPTWIASQPAWMQTTWTFLTTHPIKLAASATALIAAGIFVKRQVYQEERA